MFTAKDGLRVLDRQGSFQTLEVFLRLAKHVDDVSAGTMVERESVFHFIFSVYAELYRTYLKAQGDMDFVEARFVDLMEHYQAMTEGN